MDEEEEQSQERRKVGDKALRHKCEWAIHEMKGSPDTWQV